MTSYKPLLYSLFCLLLSIMACKTSRSIEGSGPKFKLSERLELLKMSELTGDRIDLKKYSGKPVFLNFWATWCGPCKSELETIAYVSKQFKNEITFLVASNEDPIKIKDYISENKYDLHFIHLDMEYIDAYIIKLPTTFLIDRNGQLISEEEGFRIWTQATYVKQLKKLIELGARN